LINLAFTVRFPAVNITEKVRAVITKLQRGNAAQSVEMLHWACIKTYWKWSFATLKYERALKRH